MRCKGEEKMPHISIKCYPGRTEEQKKFLAERITKDIVDIFGTQERSVSVSIQDVPPEEWDVEVWDKEIEPQRDYLYKKPGYTRE